MHVFGDHEFFLPFVLDDGGLPVFIKNIATRGTVIGMEEDFEQRAIFAKDTEPRRSPFNVRKKQAFFTIVGADCAGRDQA